MSFSIPLLDVTQKQSFTDIAGNEIQLRLHDNTLYICKVDSDGGITKGGELILDPLPDSLLYGSQGTPSSEAATGSATFDTTVEAFTAAQDDFISTMNSSTGGSTEIVSVSSGSAVVVFDVFFHSSDTTSADALLTTLSSDAGLQGLLLADGLLGPLGEQHPGSLLLRPCPRGC